MHLEPSTEVLNHGTVGEIQRKVVVSRHFHWHKKSMTDPVRRPASIHPGSHRTIDEAERSRVQ